MTVLSPRALQRLAALVAIESPTGDRAGLAAVLDLVAEWGSVAYGRVPRRAEVGGVEHLLWAASRPQVLLLCHADTVWPLGTRAGWPFAVDGARATGPGVFDMKSGLVVALEAVDRLDTDDHVSLLVTTDEETGSAASRSVIEEQARRHRAVLVLEPSADGDLKVARKGVAGYRVEIVGRAAHAGLEPEAGVNALLELGRHLAPLAGLSDPSLGTSVTPTTAAAGTTTNTVPAAARVDLDVRAWTAAELDRVDRAVRARVPYDPQARVTVTGGINRGPLEEGMADGLAATAQQVCRELGLAVPGRARVGGASDGNFTAALGVPTLDGLGPRGGHAHAPGEWVDLASTAERIELLTELLRRSGP